MQAQARRRSSATPKKGLTASKNFSFASTAQGDAEPRPRSIELDYLAELSELQAHMGRLVCGSGARSPRATQLALQRLELLLEPIGEMSDIVEALCLRLRLQLDRPRREQPQLFDDVDDGG